MPAPPEPSAPTSWPDHHVLVTGGGSGLGLATTAHLLRRGARVTICGRRRGRLDAAREELAPAGADRLASVPCDVRDPDAVEACVETGEAALGPLTGLVNNAAGNFLARSESLTPRGFDAIVRTNLYGSFHATRAAGRRWIERGVAGRVVSIVAVYAQSGSAFVLPSAVSKAGVSAMTRSLAVEWATFGIRLNAIAPGLVPTEGAWRRLVRAPEDEARMRGDIPLGRLGDPADLAHMVAFLLGDESAYVTGQVIALDGGASLVTGAGFDFLHALPRDELGASFEALRRPSRDA